MAENTDNTAGDNEEELDYDDLIGDFSDSETENKGGGEAPNLDTIALSELVGDDSLADEVPDDLFASPDAVPDKEITEIFDDLEALAGDDVVEETGNDVFANEDDSGSEDEKEPNQELCIDENTGSYAAALSEFDQKGGEPEIEVEQVFAESENAGEPEEVDFDLSFGEEEGEEQSADIVGETENPVDIFADGDDSPKSTDEDEEFAVSTAATGTFTVAAVDSADDVSYADILNEAADDTGEKEDPSSVKMKIDLSFSEDEGETEKEDSADGYADVLAGFDGDEPETQEQETGVVDIDDVSESAESEFSLDSEADVDDAPTYADTLAGFSTDTAETEDSGDAEEEIGEEDMFSFDEDEDEDEFAGGVQEEAAAEPAESERDGDDFLGLGSLTKEGAEKKKVEVLFEGIEMTFDDQVALVTKAEVLIAQGKAEEAEALFKDVSDKGGVTHWVAKRLNIEQESAPQAAVEPVQGEDVGE